MSLSISRSMRLGLVSQRGGIPVPQIITATLTPATSALTVGQSLDDTANWATFLNPANYASTAGTITSVVVNYIGDTPDATTPLADGALNRFSVTITDDAGNVRTFGTPPRTVVHVAPVAGTLAAVSETQGTGTPTVSLAAGFTGQALVYTSNQLWATVSGSTLTIADEVRAGTVRITATNSGGSASVDLSVTIAAPAVSDGDLILTDNGNGTFTITALPQPVLTLVDNGNGTITIQRII